jgi:hypothetical protein
VVLFLARTFWYGAKGPKYGLYGWSLIYANSGFGNENPADSITSHSTTLSLMFSKLCLKLHSIALSSFNL